VKVVATFTRALFFAALLGMTALTGVAVSSAEAQSSGGPHYAPPPPPLRRLGGAFPTFMGIFRQEAAEIIDGVPLETLQYSISSWLSWATEFLRSLEPRDFVSPGGPGDWMAVLAPWNLPASVRQALYEAQQQLNTTSEAKKGSKEPTTAKVDFSGFIEIKSKNSSLQISLEVGRWAVRWALGVEGTEHVGPSDSLTATERLALLSNQDLLLSVLPEVSKTTTVRLAITEYLVQANKGQMTADELEFLLWLQLTEQTIKDLETLRGDAPESRRKNQDKNFIGAVATRYLISAAYLAKTNRNLAENVRMILIRIPKDENQEREPFLPAEQRSRLIDLGAMSEVLNGLEQKKILLASYFPARDGVIEPGEVDAIKSTLSGLQSAYQKALERRLEEIEDLLWAGDHVAEKAVGPEYTDQMIHLTNANLSPEMRRLKVLDRLATYLEMGGAGFFVSGALSTIPILMLPAVHPGFQFLFDWFQASPMANRVITTALLGGSASLLVGDLTKVLVWRQKQKFRQHILPRRAQYVLDKIQATYDSCRSALFPRSRSAEARLGRPNGLPTKTSGTPSQEAP
jgi:hypothetical protein